MRIPNESRDSWTLPSRRRQTDRHTDRQTDRQTGRQAGRQAGWERETDIHAERDPNTYVTREVAKPMRGPMCGKPAEPVRGRVCRLTWNV